MDPALRLYFQAKREKNQHFAVADPGFLGQKTFDVGVELKASLSSARNAEKERSEQAGQPTMSTGRTDSSGQEVVGVVIATVDVQSQKTSSLNLSMAAAVGLSDQMSHLQRKQGSWV